VLREAGLLAIREELGTDRLDGGASRAFAVADHQVAHVYIKNAEDRDGVEKLLCATPGVARVLNDAAKAEVALHHPRSGELVAVAEADAWFTYYYWLQEARAPDFARTVDIHRKPGYDPVELFLDPAKSAMKVRLGTKLLARRLGFRTLLNPVPLDAGLVRGSHGLASDLDNGPVLLVNPAFRASGTRVSSTDIFDVILETVFRA
jgi:predicted AlkP superfamily pyrophosphatase or phosphodiesterase